MMQTRTRESGQVMVATIFIVSLMAVAAVTYLSASFQLGAATESEIGLIRARLAAEEGVHLAMAELKLGTDDDGDGIGNLSYDGGDDRNIVVTATDLGGNLYRIHSQARVGSAAQGVDAIVELQSGTAVGFPARAAITAEGPVNTLGNINVDGRDWDSWGTAVIDPGVWGISSMQTVSQGGSSTVGGHGQVPGRPAPANTIEQWASWSDGLDQDGDGSVDEEAFDGIDNDGDGSVDEDTNGYPVSPDAVLGLAPGSLRSIAERNGTLFTDQATLEDWIAANGGNIPGGQVVYADFEEWLPVNLGNSFNDPPSIIVNHSDTGSALMKNIHGAFRGLIMGDFVEHINGDFVLVGAFMSFSDDAYGNAFGNGGADVMYSSEALNNLPNTQATASARVLSWSRASVD